MLCKKKGGGVWWCSVGKTLRKRTEEREVQSLDCCTMRPCKGFGVSERRVGLANGLFASSRDKEGA